MGEVNPIRVERYILISRGSSCLVALPAYSVYLRIPPDLQETLRDRWNIDLRKDAKRVVVETSLGEEKEENGNREMVIVHKIRKLPGAR